MNYHAAPAAGRKPAQPTDFRRLKLFAIRTTETAERIYAGELAFIDGVDLVYDAAVASGLEDDFGADAVQKVMAAAFASAGGATA